MILASGARQLVVHEALESTLMSAVKDRWLTPITNMGASADGAEMMTFLAPPFRCADAFSITVKIPVDSQMMSAPSAPHGTSSSAARCASHASAPPTLCPPPPPPPPQSSPYQPPPPPPPPPGAAPRPLAWGDRSVPAWKCTTAAGAGGAAAAAAAAAAAPATPRRPAAAAEVAV